MHTKEDFIKIAEQQSEESRKSREVKYLNVVKDVLVFPYERIDEVYKLDGLKLVGEVEYDGKKHKCYFSLAVRLEEGMEPGIKTNIFFAGNFNVFVTIIADTHDAWIDYIRNPKKIADMVNANSCAKVIGC